MKWKDVLTDIVLKEGWLVSIKSFKQYQALVYETLASQVLQGRDVFVQVFYCKSKCRIVLMPLCLRKGDFPPARSVYLGTTNRKTDAGVANELPVNTGHCSQSSIFVVLIALLTCSSWSLCVFQCPCMHIFSPYRNMYWVSVDGKLKAQALRGSKIDNNENRRLYHCDADWWSLG